MIIFDRDGSNTTTVYGEGLHVQPTPQQQTQPELINKNIINIIKKIRERLSNPVSQQEEQKIKQGLKTSLMSQPALKTDLPGLKAGFENI